MTRLYLRSEPIMGCPGPNPQRYRPTADDVLRWLAGLTDEDGQARLTLADVSAFTGCLWVSWPWLFRQLAALEAAARIQRTGCAVYRLQSAQMDAACCHSADMR
jgi:hypothetical protein